MPTIGENIRAAREAAGLATQRALAKRMGVDQPQMSDWENDRYGAPDTKTLLRIAAAIGCSIDALLLGVEPTYDAARATDRDTRILETEQREGTLSIEGGQLATPGAGAAVAEFASHERGQETLNRRYLEAIGLQDAIIDAIKRLLDVLVEQQQVARTHRGRSPKARHKSAPRPRRARA